MDMTERGAGNTSSEATRLSNEIDKAMSYINLDTIEYERLHDTRYTLLTRSIENYLKCLLLVATTKEMSSLRFSVAWKDETANEVAQYIAKVPLWRLVALVDQLSSRLTDREGPDDNAF